MNTLLDLYVTKNSLIDLVKYLTVDEHPIPPMILTAGAITNNNLTITLAK